jgi:hypothetical protein
LCPAAVVETFLRENFEGDNAIMRERGKAGAEVCDRE